MKVIPAHKAQPQAIDACLHEMAKRDLFLAQSGVTQPIENGWVAVIDDSVAGLGWYRDRGPGANIDVRVLPRYRKIGVGTALFNAVTEGRPRPWHASCDAAQTSAIQFLESRQFQLDGAVYAQRWDGAIEDVPPAFKTASLVETDDYERVRDVLRQAYGDHWLQPTIRTNDLENPNFFMHLAVKKSEPVGALIGYFSKNTIIVSGLGTIPSERRQGVGRVLLCDLMSRAAAKEYGIAARIPSEHEHTVDWTRALGFWTYRSWIYFSAQE